MHSEPQWRLDWWRLRLKDVSFKLQHFEMTKLKTGIDKPEDKIKDNNQPTYSKKFDDQVYCVQFSPYEWSHDILCIAFGKKICIAQVKFEVEFEFKIIGEFNHEVLCTCVAIAPQTSLSVLPKILQFCTACDDYKLRFFKSDLAKNNTCQILSGHTNYINDICFESSENNYLASVSDDQTARVWETIDGTCLTVFYLTSPGVSICWHNEDNAKLMVCEKNGIIRFYNVHSQQPILSLENNSPVSFAHWSPTDSQLVGAMQQGELVLWDLTRPSRPAHTKIIHVDGGGHMQFSPLGNLVATVNSLTSCIKVTQLQNGQTKLNAPVLLPTNATWHYRLPLICIGNDRNICFWKIDPN